MVIRYRKKIALDSEMLPRIADGIVSGVTDIIRLNVERLLHDMDDPEYALDYVDLEDFSVEQAADRQELPGRRRLPLLGRRRPAPATTVRLVRLVLDRNGIKRMSELSTSAAMPTPLPCVPDSHSPRASPGVGSPPPPPAITPDAMSHAT